LSVASVESRPCDLWRMAVEQGGEHIAVIASDVAEPFEDVITFEQTDFHQNMWGCYSTARVSKRFSHQSAACLRARYCYPVYPPEGGAPNYKVNRRWKDFGRVKASKPSFDSVQPRPESFTPVHASAGSR